MVTSGLRRAIWPMEVPGNRMFLRLYCDRMGSVTGSRRRRPRQNPLKGNEHPLLRRDRRPGGGPKYDVYHVSKDLTGFLAFY